jgi:predicted DNA-binding transcriptional regulator AlpA
MSKGWLRFRDLKARGFVQSWAQLRRLTELYSFPPGRMISPNTRAWTEEEIDAYYRSCPVEGPEPRGAAKERRDRRRKDSTTSTTA